jgi:hypothetical protein
MTTLKKEKKIFPYTQRWQKLEVQALGFALALSLEYPLPGSSEVFHLDSHSTLPQRHETRLRADGFNIGAREVVLMADEFIKVDIFAQGHLAGVQRKDLSLGVFYGEKKLASELKIMQ